MRTPSTDIRYGETTLYETGCMPPYQARLYAESGMPADELRPGVLRREIAAAVREEEEPEDVQDARRPPVAMVTG